MAVKKTATAKEPVAAPEAPKTAKTPLASGAVEGVYRADLGESLPPQKKAGE